MDEIYWNIILHTAVYSGNVVDTQHTKIEVYPSTPQTIIDQKQGRETEHNKNKYKI